MLYGGRAVCFYLNVLRERRKKIFQERKGRPLESDSGILEGILRRRGYGGRFSTDEFLVLPNFTQENGPAGYWTLRTMIYQ